MSAGTSNRDGRPSNPALTTGTLPPRGAPLELALPFDYALKIFGRSQPRRDGPGQPCAFFRWPPTRLPGGFPAPPSFNGVFVPEHLTTPLLLGAFFSLLRHGLRRCGAPGQRPSLFPAVPHRPVALVRFFHSPARSTLAVGREGRSPNIACQRRASSALGTPSCSTSRRYPSPVPTASTAGTSPIYSTAE